jgi:hypothetical protein
LKKLDNGMQQKINMLGRWDADCADVVMWLLRNKDTNDFAKRVEIPAAVSVTVRDKHYVNAVESCFNANQLKARGVSVPYFRVTSALCCRRLLHTARRTTRRSTDCSTIPLKL